MNPKEIQDLKDLVAKLQGQVSDLASLVGKNNFSGTQTFNKDCIFYSRLKVPHYSSAPSVSEVGDIIEVGGVLYICTTAGGVFTKVGAQ